MTHFSFQVGREVTEFNARDVVARHLASGDGPTHAYVLDIAPDGVIGDHVAGFDQLFVVLAGSAWIIVNGERFDLETSEGALVRKGDTHSKGSTSGASALMIQCDRIHHVAQSPVP